MQVNMPTCKPLTTSSILSLLRSKNASMRSPSMKPFVGSLFFSERNSLQNEWSILPTGLMTLFNLVAISDKNDANSAVI